MSVYYDEGNVKALGDERRLTDIANLGITIIVLNYC